MPRDATISCPRCGYDQRGTVAGWTVSCPLEGVCVECGLEWAWSEVLQPERHEPRWCVEFAGGGLGTLRAGVVTALRSFRPWSFWRAMRMSHAVRSRRLVAYLTMLAIVVLGALVVEQGAVAIALRRAAGTWPSLTAVRQSYGAAVQEAVLFPLGSTSRGRVTWRGGYRDQYFGPVVMHGTLLAGPRRWGGRGNHLFELIGMVLLVWVYGTLIALLMPAAFVLLPVSRRRAQVRWAHLWRVGAYSVIFPATAMLVLVLSLGAGVLMPPLFGSLRAVAVGATVVLAAPATIVWWSFAIGRYLQLPHVPAVATLLSLLLYLLIPTSVLVLVQSLA